MDAGDHRRYELLFACFMAVFVTLVVLTNTVGVKLFTAGGMILPVSIIWYPLTFLVTDIVSEIYGARRARFLVIMGFCMSVLLLAFSLIGIGLPVASVYPLQQDYENIFGPIWRLLFASMAAYLPAQLVDSLTVNLIFLYRNPTVFTGTLGDLLGIILGVYLVKVAIAALDTPLCYLGVWAVRRAAGIDGPTGAPTR